MRSIILAMIVALVPAQAGAGAHGDQRRHRESVVLAWNDAALEAVRRTQPGPTIVARALADLFPASSRSSMS